MKDQFCRGGLKFISFILLDLICLVLSNCIAVQMYTNLRDWYFGIQNYIIIILYMAVIDIVVTTSYNTLDRVLRRKLDKEMIECVKHVGISFVMLALLLFSTKQGAEFSRITVYFAYAIDLVLLIITHIIWKKILGKVRKKKPEQTALLVTTFGYANEGLGVVERAGMIVKGMFITDKTNEGIVRDIPVIVDRADATAFVCWEWIDKVYICGPAEIDVPESLLNACKQMGIPVFTAPAGKSLDFEIVKIRTALQKDDKDTGLSFFEGEHDIPFRISRVYTIFESEQENQRGFHAHKQSWHLLFCPYGTIDVAVDTGRERKTISLNDPSMGLILHPSVWREIFWRKSGSVLCVAASGHYEPEKLRDSYDDYVKFLQEKEWAATIESAEIMGEEIV